MVLYEGTITTECVGLVAQKRIPYYKVLDQQKLIITINNVKYICDKKGPFAYTFLYGADILTFEEYPFYILSTAGEEYNTVINTLYVQSDKAGKYTLKIETI